MSRSYLTSNLTVLASTGSTSYASAEILKVNFLVPEKPGFCMARDNTGALTNQENEGTKHFPVAVAKKESHFNTN